HGPWQRPLERRRLCQAPLLLPSSPGALAEAAAAVPGCAERALVVPSPIAGCPPGDGGSTPAIPMPPREDEDLPGSATDAGPAGREPDPMERDIAAITYAANPRKKG